MRSTAHVVTVRALSVCVLLGAFLGALHGQESRGTITGRITDASDAVVPGVKVTAKNTATNQSTQAVTNSTGSFLLPYLSPGIYDLTAETAGFATTEQRGIQVQVGDKLGINFQLKPAGVTSSVLVNETTPLLSTETATSGTVIDERQIAELPLPFGTPFMLANLSPGVVFTAANMLQIRPYDNGVVANMRVDGAPGGNEFSLDGAPDTADSRGLQKGMNVSFIPPPDAVQEFKMETSSFDARLGHSPGAAVNVVLKSGTNGLHGSGWEFTRFQRTCSQRFLPAPGACDAAGCSACTGTARRSGVRRLCQDSITAATTRFSFSRSRRWTRTVSVYRPGPP
ncbi:MAG: carboxypeptidase-like regulatory domain-containing protein [Acidobacteriia bacterium]|nr:carboxypeptidase-like regulatory domain-containing protein [Terriglobia bacterium]